MPLQAVFFSLLLCVGQTVHLASMQDVTASMHWAHERLQAILQNSTFLSHLEQLGPKATVSDSDMLTALESVGHSIDRLSALLPSRPRLPLGERREHLHSGPSRTSGYNRPRRKLLSTGAAAPACTVAEIMKAQKGDYSISAGCVSCLSPCSGGRTEQKACAMACKGAGNKDVSDGKDVSGIKIEESCESIDDQATCQSSSDCTYYAGYGCYRTKKSLGSKEEEAGSRDSDDASGGNEAPNDRGTFVWVPHDQVAKEDTLGSDGNNESTITPDMTPMSGRPIGKGVQSWGRPLSMFA